jgi:hypothetical protein
MADKLTLILHKFPFNGRGQAVQKGFQANLQSTRHGPFIPELELTEGGILPFHQIFRLTALGSLEEGLALARLCNWRVDTPQEAGERKRGFLTRLRHRAPPGCRI